MKQIILTLSIIFFLTTNIFAAGSSSSSSSSDTKSNYDQAVKLIKSAKKNEEKGKKDMGYIARSAFPLFLLMVLAVILVVIFPEIALWMPEQMIKNIN